MSWIKNLCRGDFVEPGDLIEVGVFRFKAPFALGWEKLDPHAPVHVFEDRVSATVLSVSHEHRTFVGRMSGGEVLAFHEASRFSIVKCFRDG